MLTLVQVFTQLNQITNSFFLVLQRTYTYIVLYQAYLRCGTRQEVWSVYWNSNSQTIVYEFSVLTITPHEVSSYLLNLYKIRRIGHQVRHKLIRNGLPVELLKHYSPRSAHFSSSSSSSWMCTDITDSCNSLSPSALIGYCFWQTLLTAFGFSTELMKIMFSWCLHGGVHRKTLFMCHPDFLYQAQYFSLLLLGWFVKWKASGWTVVLCGATSRISSKQKAANLSRSYLFLQAF